MFDKKENRFQVTESMCSTVADMLLFNIYEQIKEKPVPLQAKTSETVLTEKRARKAGA